MEQKYDVFISYSRKDMAVADEICEALDRANISYFIDKQDIKIGHPFAEIARAIKECTLFLFLGSHNAYVSIYAPKEINYAIRHKEKNNIVPFLIDNTPLPDELDLLLCDYNWLTKREHPIKPVLVNNLLDHLGRKHDQSVIQNRTQDENHYIVTLNSCGVNKLQIVKNLKELLNIGLKEAKDIVDAAPCDLPRTFPFNEANAIKRQLESNGAIVHIDSISVPKLDKGKYYIEVPNTKGQDISGLDAITSILPFSRVELLNYMAYGPCILPFLLDSEKASYLMGKTKLRGIAIRLIPYTSETANVKFKLLSTNNAKLQVVKYLKEHLNIGLAQAKEYVDTVPIVVASSNDFEQTNWFANGLREIGAVVSLQLK